MPSYMGWIVTLEHEWNLLNTTLLYVYSINPENSNDLTENIKNINTQKYSYFNANKEFQFSW